MGTNIYEKRIVELNNAPIDSSGNCVIYWMQRSQRAFDNPALSFAIELANSLMKPLLVYFALYDAYPMASVRVFKFMLEGLKETAKELEESGIGFIIRREAPAEGIVQMAHEFRACAVVVDEDYLNIGRLWRSAAAKELDIRLIQIDSETVVPARISDHEEWGAYTIRPKILKHLEEYLIDIPENKVLRKWNSEIPHAIDLCNINPVELALSLHVDQKVDPTPYFYGGASKAQERLRLFIETRLPRYSAERNDIGVSVSSELSPYLHFGQIASRRIALIVRKTDAPDECVDTFLEQLIVRRELAINFCLYNTNYAQISGAADWALKTLETHKFDPRPEIYTLDELEASSTHDNLWNAAQNELMRFGMIHPYMRMVWAKKLLEWSPTPQQALANAIYLNDKYALDGRDSNGYTGIAWSIFGKHDRPFAERPIFGKVRYMSSDATKRKTHWQDYIARISDLSTTWKSI